jgi:hypothetical protein
MDLNIENNKCDSGNYDCDCKNVILELNNKIKSLTDVVDGLKNEVKFLIDERDKKYSDKINRKCEVIGLLSNCKATIPNGTQLGNNKEMIDIVAEYISKKTKTICDAKKVTVCFIDFITERGLSYGMVTYSIDVHYSRISNFNRKTRHNFYWKIVSGSIKIILDYYYENMLMKL